jgi:hypothetical protein
VVAGTAIAAAVSLFAMAPRGGGATNTARGAKFLALNAPGGMRFTDQTGDISVAPDGRSIVVVATTDDGTSRLYLRRFDDPAWRALPGTEGAYFPFWSGDGRLVGFFASNKLKKIAIGGSIRLPIGDAAAGRGGTWNQDGVIVFAPGPSGPLMQVKAEGAPSRRRRSSMPPRRGRAPLSTIPSRRAAFPLFERSRARGGHDSWLATLGAKSRTLVVNSDGVPRSRA